MSSQVLKIAINGLFTIFQLVFNSFLNVLQENIKTLKILVNIEIRALNIMMLKSLFQILKY